MREGGAPEPRQGGQEIREHVAYPVLHESAAFDPYSESMVPSRRAMVYMQYAGTGLEPWREDAALLGRKVRLVPGANPAVDRTTDTEAWNTPTALILARPYGTQVAEAKRYGILPPEPED